MVGVGRDLKDGPVQHHLPRAACSKPRPSQPWTLLRMEHPQHLWANCPSASLPSRTQSPPNTSSKPSHYIHEKQLNCSYTPGNATSSNICYYNPKLLHFQPLFEVIQAFFCYLDLKKVIQAKTELKSPEQFRGLLLQEISMFNWKLVISCKEIFYLNWW